MGESVKPDGIKLQLGYDDYLCTKQLAEDEVSANEQFLALTADLRQEIEALEAKLPTCEQAQTLIGVLLFAQFSSSKMPEDCALLAKLRAIVEGA